MTELIEKLLAGFREWSVRRAFNAHREEFYKDLASSLRSGANLKELITQYANANEKNLSPMMQRWQEGFLRYPDSFAKATRNYVDKDDLIVIAAAEKTGVHGHDLFLVYANNLRQRTKMLNAVIVPLIIPAITLCVLFGITALFKLKIFAQMLKDIPIQKWPDYALPGIYLSNFLISSSGIIFAAVMISIIIWMSWSFQNFTGKGRDFLDRKIFPYTIIGQMNSLSATTVMAAMVASRFKDVDALELVKGNGSRWLKWRLDKISDRAREGKTVFSSLACLPLSTLFCVRVNVMSLNAATVKEDLETPEGLLNKTLPELIVDACMNEGEKLVENLDKKAKVMTVATVLLIAVVVGCYMVSILGFSEAAQAMADSMRAGR